MMFNFHSIENVIHGKIFEFYQYMSIFRQLSWVEAQRSCEKEGMTLLSNFYDETMKLVVKYYREMGFEIGDVIFIGLKRNKQVDTNRSPII